MNEELNNEIFHIIHSAIWYINQERTEENKILILDKEIGNAIRKISLTEEYEK